MPDDERGLEASLGGLDGLDPRLEPQRLERHQRLGHRVVRLHRALRLLGAHDGLVGGKFAHGLLDAPQQLPRPHDVSGDGGRVTWQAGGVLVLFVDLLHRVQIQAVVLEDDHVLVVQVLLERLALQDALELAQQVQRVLRAGDVLERAVDEPLQRHLQVVDVDVELEEIAVELVLGVVQQIVGLALEVVGDFEKVLDHLLEAIDVRVLGEGGELVNRGEHVD
mmetsp:Transcript_14323/g.34907  ORF Transcript_14323/g.34907 Transcript_14323/m.34907 type:complete len:222 (+) Transcript_14323:3726-4391(+)